MTVGPRRWERLSIGTSECDNARMDAVIRRARESDASFVAWTQQTAARSHLERGFWDVAIPGPDAPRLELIAARSARSQPEAFCHWKRFLIAEVDGAPAAALSGMSRRATAARPSSKRSPGRSGAQAGRTSRPRRSMRGRHRS
jgi:hypothetical protein